MVADPRAELDAWEGPSVDWDATLAFRRFLWGLGLRVAEAMDTSQRGMGLDWPVALELIRRSVAEARGIPGAEVACGVGTDQLPSGPGLTLERVRAAYEEQLEAVEAAGGHVILMASRALAAVARSAEDYLQLYGTLLRQAREPVILHWLGPMFDPALEGYWGSRDLDQATTTLLALLHEHASHIAGVKISLLDREREIALRRRLPPGVAIFTGDDFNYPDLIEGDAGRYSDALLGIFDPIAQPASAALAALTRGEVEDYRRILAPTVPLARAVFGAPTRFYKAGIVLLAWLGGHQDHFTMIGGMQSARSALHYADVFRLASAARLFSDPGLACARMRTLMLLYGID